MANVSPGGYDGVALDYVDPLTNKKAYIYLQIDSSGITEVEDATVNAMQISLDGCRNATRQPTGPGLRRENSLLTPDHDGESARRDPGCSRHGGSVS